MQPKVFGKTDVGKKRKNNEDAFLIDEELGLYAVADGMGGHAAGEVASNMALDITKKELNNWSGVLNEYKPDSSAEVRDVILNLIEETLQRACQAVYKESVDNPDRQGMGTTVSMVLIKNDSAFLGHVGDSRIYLVRQGAVHQLSEDHSLVNEMYKQGRIGTSEAEQASYRNVITRAVGHTERVRVDTLQMDLLPGDRLLLCSDGLSDYLRPGDIEKILKAGPVEGSPDRFVEYALGRGGKDNVTVVLVEIPGDDATSADALLHRMKAMYDAPLFSLLEYRELVALMSVSYIRKVSEGEFITQKDETTDELLILTQGEARVLVEEREVARVREGTHIGEISFFSTAPRATTVQATTASELLVVGRQQFYKFLNRETVAGMKILWRLVQMSIRRTHKTAVTRVVEDLTPPWMLRKKPGEELDPEDW
jgi:serine/threonine protein phosphatase PrpC